MTDSAVFGLDMPVERYDILAFRHIRPGWLAFEVHLMTSKWFDYRFMNPVAATYLYAHHYVAEYRAAYRRAIDYKTAAAVRALKNPDLFLCPPVQISAMWRGRQHADAMGIPYALYIRWAIEARMSYWDRGKMPRPQMLYSELVTDKVQAKWEEYVEGVMELAQHEAFQLKNYVGLKTQDEHVEWAMQLSAKRQNIGAVLAALLKKNLISIGNIAHVYNDDVATRVVAMAGV